MIICGIVCIVSGGIILVFRLGFDEVVLGSTDIPMSLTWFVVGIYFCYLGRKMRKKED